MENSGISERAHPRSGLFAREATGLVREASWIDTAFFNLIFAALPVTFAFIALYGPGFYPGASLFGGILLAFLVSAPAALIYSMFGSAIPRSGADYIWISRAIHPALGFASSLSWNLWNVYFVAVNASVFVAVYWAAPFMNTLASYFSNPGLTQVADFFQSRVGTFVVGAIVIVLSAMLLSYTRGLAVFMRVVRYSFLIWLVSGVILPIIIFSVTSQSEFVGHFDEFISNLGGPPDAHRQVVESAGWVAGDGSFYTTFQFMTIPFFTAAFLMLSAYFGGEIKRPQRSSFLGIIGALVLGCVFLLGLTASTLQGVGRETLGSLALVDGASISHPTPFTYTELAAIAADNPVIGIIITLGMLSFFLVVVPAIILVVSRSLFAWAFDKLIPEWFAEVNPKSHSPVRAIMTIAVVAFIPLIAITIDPTLTALAGILALILTFVAVCIAGVVFPYTQREVFEASPVNGRIGRVPVMTIVGLLGLVGMSLGIAAYLLDPGSGTSWSGNPERVIFAVGVFLAGLPLFYIIKAIRKSRGVDISLAYREIPSE